MTKPMTMQQFFATFPDDEACLDHLFVTRYGERNVQCPKCSKVGKFYRIAADAGLLLFMVRPSHSPHGRHPVREVPHQRSSAGTTPCTCSP